MFHLYYFVVFTGTLYTCILFLDVSQAIGVWSCVFPELA